jgi:hypothetical protein
VRARELEPNYRTEHTLYLGSELELYVQQHSGHAGYWLGVRETEGADPTELAGYTAVDLSQLRRAADALAAVVERLEREEEQ